MNDIARRMAEQADQLAQDRIERNARIRELERALARIHSAADDYLAERAAVSGQFVLKLIRHEVERALPSIVPASDDSEEGGTPHG